MAKEQTLSAGVPSDILPGDQGNENSDIAQHNMPKGAPTIRRPICYEELRRWQYASCMALK